LNDGIGIGNVTAGVLKDVQKRAGTGLTLQRFTLRAIRVQERGRVHQGISGAGTHGRQMLTNVYLATLWR
jgi:hypothetical protein